MLSKKIKALRFRANQWWRSFVRRVGFGSFSQYGEDLIIDAILGKERPFYVDIGANHPTHLSNTYLFYRRGAHGINIEPDPSAFPTLAARRPLDINLQVGCGQREKMVPFYRMSASTLSTFNLANAEEQARSGYRIVETVPVPIRPLAMILAEHRPDGNVDFMSIDVEGYEKEILDSNDWTRFRPLVLAIEINRNERQIITLMQQLNYILVVNNGTNGIFLDQLAQRTGA